MFDLFSPSVTEKNNLIYVSSINTRKFERDIQIIFKTSRVNKYMFKHVGRRDFIIYSFFALELYHVIEKLIHNRRIISNVRHLKTLQEGLLNKTWLAKTTQNFNPRLDFEKLKNLKWAPLDFQMNFLKTYSDNLDKFSLKGMLLAGTAGSGKTFTTICVGECLSAERIIIVCPKNAINRVWEDTILKVFKSPQSYWYHASGKPYNNERFSIFHYEALEHIDAYVEDFKTKKTFVILDESHNLNEIKSLRTQRFIDFCKAIDVKDVILASGTAVKALSVETIPLFRVIDSLFTPEVEESFKRMYQGDVSLVTDILALRLNNVSFKITKKELDLDEPIFRELKIKIPNGDNFTLESIGRDMETFVIQQEKYYTKLQPEADKFFWECVNEAYTNLLNASPTNSRKLIETEYETYRKTVTEIIKFFRKGGVLPTRDQFYLCNRYEKEIIIPNLSDKFKKDKFKDYKSITKYYQLKIRGECLGRVLGRARIDAHVAMVPFIDFDTILNSTTKKTVVFTTYAEVVAQCETHLKSQNYSPVTVYGANTTDLNNTVKLFEHSVNINPLIATYASLSTAVPLVMADTMILINTPFRNYVLEQAISRIHRLGADTQICVYTLSIDTGDIPNISTRTVDILKWSQEQVAKILKIDASYKVDDLDTDVNSIAQECINPVDTDLLYLENLNTVTESIETINTKNYLTKNSFLNNW